VKPGFYLHETNFLSNFSPWILKFYCADLCSSYVW